MQLAFSGEQFGAEQVRWDGVLSGGWLLPRLRGASSPTQRFRCRHSAAQRAMLCMCQVSMEWFACGWSQEDFDGFVVSGWLERMCSAFLLRVDIWRWLSVAR